MEFRCRLGTAGGEIVEGVYVAESEARLRRELEEKGLFVLSLHRRGILPAFGGVPPFRETQNYVARILRLLGRS